MTKRASYREAIEVIAFNDESAEHDPQVVAGLASVLVIAAIFGKDQDTVANDVVKYRIKDVYK